LYDTGLSGKLPTEVGLLRNLKYLRIGSGTSFTGKLPTEIGLLSNLIELEVNDSLFTGTIPSEINAGNLPNLRRAIFTDGQFTGTVPLCGITTLQADCDGVSNEVVCECCTYCCATCDRTPTMIPSVSPTLSLKPSTQPTGFDSTELYTLIQFGESTQSDGWTYNRYWGDTSRAYCSWMTSSYYYRYRCSGDKVYFFNFHNNNLNGTLPNSIGNLRYAVEFRPRDNPDLTGTLPTEVGLMESLEYVRYILYFFCNYLNLPTYLFPL